jgi:hypothetical protein
MMLHQKETLISALFVIGLILFVFIFNSLGVDASLEDRAKYEAKCANQCAMRGRDYEFHPTEEELKNELNRLTRRNRTRYIHPVESCECR